MPAFSTKKRILPILVILAISGLIIATFELHWFSRKPRTGADITLYGNINLREVQLAFQEPGRIQKMLLQTGNQVKKGALVGSLDAHQYTARVAQAKARLAAAKAVLARLLAGTRPQDIDRLRAVIQTDEAELKLHTLTYRRIGKLAAQSLASKESLDQARAAMQTATGKLKADQATLALAIAGPRIQEIEQARAQVQADQAALNLAKITLGYTRLYIPADGVIRNRILEPGDMASPQVPVYTLALTNPLWVRAYIDEADLGRINLGNRAWITSDSFPNKRFPGWIGFISPTAEFTPKSVETTQVRTELVYEVRVYTCNTGNSLRLGMPVTVTVDAHALRVNLKQSPCTQLEQ